MKIRSWCGRAGIVSWPVRWQIFSLMSILAAGLVVLLVPSSGHGQSGGVSLTLLSSFAELDEARSVAWGDVDSDGDLDLAVGSGMSNRVYRNDGGVLNSAPSWFSTDYGNDSVAWGDVDGDGDLDLAAGNRFYRNDGGVLTSTAVWSATDGGWGDAAWGDVDGDGDLDLAAGTRLYRNDGGVLTSTAVWSSTDDGGDSIAWGDVDGDGDLDLAASSWDASRLYRNDGGVLTSTAVWSSTDDSHWTYGVAWGDVDGDGDLDLAKGTQLYRNDGGMLTSTAVWSPDENGGADSVAWGDADGDGDLDLAMGVLYFPERIYCNDGGVLSTHACWYSSKDDDTYSIAWGDVDGDGDLDLAVGNKGEDYRQASRLYRNDGGVLTQSAAWSTIDGNDSDSVAWGDVDGDDDLDLAVGSNYLDQPSRLYRNDGGVLTATAVWSAMDRGGGEAAWGDVDNDGDLDLALNDYLYRNDGGVLTSTAVWSSTNGGSSVAWGDVDSDGDLDLITGDSWVSWLYRNDGGVLTSATAWSPIELDETTSVAWGDVDNDGDLDLGVGNGPSGSDYGSPNRLYRNDGGILTSTAIWSSIEDDSTSDIAWGDVDGDGDLDLAVANGGEFTGHPIRLYRNDGGVLTSSAAWSSIDEEHYKGLAWGDVDGDGDLDLAANNHLYRNEKGMLTEIAVWSSTEGVYESDSVAWGDVDGDGDLDLVIANYSIIRLYRNNRSSLALNGAVPIANLHLAPGYAGADFYSTANIWTAPTLPITFQLFHPKNIAAGRVLGYYSLNGGGRWLPATPTMDTDTTDLASAPYPAANAGNTHTFTWDIAADGVMGQSDNVVFRLVVMPSFKPVRNAIAGPFMQGSYAVSTFPFRVRGTQVQVIGTGNQGVSQAQVYRLLGGQANNAQLYTQRSGLPYHTDSQGYLQGRGELRKNDSLAALWPVPPANGVPFTTNSALYLTSARPTATSLDMKVVDQPGVQVLTVSSDNKLLLFNLDVALEWDARKDAQFLEQLRFSLARASDLLFDWTNGQVAIGQVRIFHDAKRYPPNADFNPWTDSHIRIYASNHIRPSAAVGGIISPTLELSETVQSKTIVYGPGQVRMGATWNRYGEPSGNLGDDWARALAHELGHYLFFLEDDYLGVDDQGMLVTVPAEGDPNTACPSAMNDPYRESLSEFQPSSGWTTPGCARTLAQQSTGRSDWQTIRQFYPFLAAPNAWNANPGPGTQPLAVTQLHEFSPTLAAATVDVPIFYLTHAQSGGTYLPGANAQAFLFQGDWLTDLGQPTLDQVQAWGARPGDRLCVLEPSAGYFGCESIHTGADQVAMAAKGAWQPEIAVTPVTSYTIAVSVAPPLQGSALCARLYPSDEAAKQPMSLQLTPSGAYATLLPATDAPTLEGYVHLWLPEAGDSGCTEPQGNARLETVTGYAVGGNPIHLRARRTLTRAGGVHLRARRAPVISADGQVMVFGDVLDRNQEQEWSFTLQATSAVASLPPGRTLVGQGYRLSASANAPDLAGAIISFGYLGEQVPAGEESFLRIYFRQPDSNVCQAYGLTAPCWEPLDTFRDTEYNFASAKTRGTGLYVLMSSFEIPLANKGWNSFAYSLPQAQPVQSALDSLAGAYSIVYSYRPDQPGNEWTVFSPAAPTWANDLSQLEFGRGYWIYTTSPITLYLSNATGIQAASAAAGLTPPAVIYGTLQPTADFVPTPGMEVTAWIGDKLCGRTQVQTQDGNPVYVVKVSADDDGAYDGCGADGRTVGIRVNGGQLTAHAAWNNTIVQVALGSATPTHQIFLPDITAGSAEAD